MNLKNLDNLTSKSGYMCYLPTLSIIDLNVVTVSRRGKVIVAKSLTTSKAHALVGANSGES